MMFFFGSHVIFIQSSNIKCTNVQHKLTYGLTFAQQARFVPLHALNRPLCIRVSHKVYTSLYALSLSLFLALSIFHTRHISQFTAVCCPLFCITMLRLYYLLHAKIHQFLGSRQSRRRTVGKAHSQFILLKYWWIFCCFTLKATISFNINRQARAFGIITFSQRIINRLTLTRALTNVCDCVTGKVVSCVCFHLFMANSLCLFLAFSLCRFHSYFSTATLKQRFSLLLFHFRCVRYVL